MRYEVERGIPIPPQKLGRREKYPFRDMKVGDSFEIRVDKYKDTQNACHVFGHRNKRKYACRRMPDKTYRCFRLA